MTVKNIPIKDITINSGTQQRPLDDDVVKRYAAMMREKDIPKGEEFPPVEIITDGENNYLVDGFHRVAAARKNSKIYIEAFVVKGNRREAIFLSFSANKKNAFPRQPGTVKAIVEKILKDKEWAKMPQSEIARYVGCTQPFVSKIQADVEKLSYNQLYDRTAKSGQKQGLLRPKTVKVKRGKSEYEMKTAEKKTLDSTGKKVPEHLIKYFSRANEYRAMIKQLNDMLKTVRDGKNASDLFYKFIKIENLTAEIGNVKRIFRFAMPYAICRYCMADFNNKECRACDGAGFVNEMTFRSTLEELK